MRACKFAVLICAGDVFTFISNHSVSEWCYARDFPQAHFQSLSHFLKG